LLEGIQKGFERGIHQLTQTFILTGVWLVYPQYASVLKCICD
jgi:hypothetical protein